MNVCVCYLGLLNRCVKCLFVHHSEGDTLWLGRENPADDGPVVAHSDGNGAVATGFDKQLSGTIAKMRYLIYVQRHRGTTERHSQDECVYMCFYPRGDLNLNEHMGLMGT